jgi:hypothetical protein
VSGSAYEIAALTMRFWFAALMVFLLWRIVRAVLRDYASQRTVRKADAGYSLGMLEVVGPEWDDRGKPHPLYGRRFALKRENRIGRARGADIRVNHGKIAPYQASIFQKGNRVLLSDLGGKSGVFLNGERIAEDTPLIDGDEIAVGDVEFVLHLMSATQGRRASEFPRQRRESQDDESMEVLDPPMDDTDEDWDWEEAPSWARYVPREDEDDYPQAESEPEHDPDEDEDEGEYGRKRRRWRR